MYVWRNVKSAAGNGKNVERAFKNRRILQFEDITKNPCFLSGFKEHTPPLIKKNIDGRIRFQLESVNWGRFEFGGICVQ